MKRERVPWSRLALALMLPVLLALPVAATPVPPPTDTTIPTDTMPEEFPTDTMVPEEEVPTDTSMPSTTTYYEEDDDFTGADEEGAFACATCMAFGAVLPLVILGISIAIAIWI